MAKEQILIQRARLFGDREAFGMLVRMHQSKLRSFLIRLARKPDIADDLAQETLLVAYEKLGSFKSKGKFSSWLLQIAYSKFLQYLRSTNRRDEVNKIFAIEQTLVADYFDAPSAEQYDLELAMLKLKPEQTAALTLCHSYGYSHSEAAAILKLPVGTIKTNILRGKQLLRDRLSDSGKARKRA